MVMQMQIKPEELLLPILHHCYDVEVEGMLGAPILTLNLFVHQSGRLLNGAARVYNPTTYPPVDLHYILEGQYREITFSDNQLVIVTLTGHEPRNPIIPLFEALMVLSKDWKDGTSEYEYKASSEAPWQAIRNARVKSISCSVESH